MDRVSRRVQEEFIDVAFCNAQIFLPVVLLSLPVLGNE
jgi:hypothetical protein